MIELRDLTPDDSDRLFHWRRLPEVDRWMTHEPPHDHTAHLCWYEGLRSDLDRRGWIITGYGRPVGFFSLSGLRAPHRQAHWGWYIGDSSARGRGFGRAAQALGLERAFGEFDLEEVRSEVFSDNEAALKAQTAAGFSREEGSLRRVWKAGRPRDLVALSMLRTQWEALRARTLDDLSRAGLIKGPQT